MRAATTARIGLLDDLMGVAQLLAGQPGPGWDSWEPADEGCGREEGSELTISVPCVPCGTKVDVDLARDRLHMRTYDPKQTNFRQLLDCGGGGGGGGGWRCAAGPHDREESRSVSDLDHLARQGGERERERGRGRERGREREGERG